MRPEIKRFETYFWGLEKTDIVYTADLTKAYLKAYFNTIKLPDEKMFTPEIDLYLNSHYRETQFLIHFGIWRLQSIFETLLKANFNIKTNRGLRDILKSLKNDGYIIIEERELMLWTNLRNKLSHSAPERFHPAPSNLIQSDIDDYSSLLLRVYENLEIQAKSKKTT